MGREGGRKWEWKGKEDEMGEGKEARNKGDKGERRNIYRIDEENISEKVKTSV